MNDRNNDKSIDAPITLADIDELRAALGAEADIEGISIDAAPAAVSTVMCPAHPWDTK